MDVVILSDHDCEGGAAIATCRVEASISMALRETGRDNDVYRVVHFPDGKVTPIANLSYEESTAKRWLFGVPRRVLPARFPRPNTPAFAARRLRAVLKSLKPDIINVHNLHVAAPWGWGPHLVEVCLEFAPVVWTLHDMWSFTGRCAYSYDCEKFITGCDEACPTPNELPALTPQRIRPAWDERRAIYQRHRDDLIVVAPSRWLAEQARRGLFAEHRVEVIPYGIEKGVHLWHDLEIARSMSWTTEVGARFRQFSEFHRLQGKLDRRYEGTFFPAPRDEARASLGIRPAGPVLLLAAFDLTERRKGAHLLPHLWKQIEQRPLTVLTMGHGSIRIDDPLIEVHPLGNVDDDAKKTLVYSAADALLHPAPVDNLPNVVLEALACGTPAIAMPVGGVPELVRPDVSGWLADSATPDALARAVDRALRDLWLGKCLRESCRSLIDKEYSLALQGRRYVELFQQLLRRG